MYERLEYQNSDELCRKMANECDTVILSFSTGKDSIAAWLQLRKYFKKIVPYYCYLIPDISFVEESLRYYEDFFGQHIYRLPHNALPRMLRALVFQPPEHVTKIETLDLPGDEYDATMIGEIIRTSEHLPSDAFVGTGVRTADSPIRKIAIQKNGAVNFSQKKFHPVYDWKKKDILQAIDDVGVRLPIDYELFGRTFDGIDYRFLKPIKERFPNDYQRILDWFPLADLELFRRGEE